MWTALMTIAAAVVIPVAVLWVVFYGEAVLARLRSHLSSPPVPGGPPIETLAADLRRLRTATQSVAPGTSQVRRVAVLAAYDDALIEACHALGLPDTLSGLRPGPDREVERTRLELLLEMQGLRFTSGQ